MIGSCDFMQKTMRKILMVFCIAAIFAVPVYATNWKSIGMGKSGAHIYLDLDSVEKIDTNTAIFWMRGDDFKEGMIGYVYTAFNRSTNEYTLIKINVYNLNGQLIGMFNYGGISEVNHGMRPKTFKNKHKVSNNDQTTRQIKNWIWPNY